MKKLSWILWFIFITSILSINVLAKPGDLDTTFGGGNGYVIPGFENGSPYKIAIQADGKIVLAGAYYGGEFSYYIIVARFLTDGTLDTAGFNAPNGYYLLNTSQTFAEEANSVIILTTGKILIVGSSFSNEAAADAVMIARLNANGTLDTTFGGGKGYVQVPIGTMSTLRLKDATLDPNGKIVVAGEIMNEDFLIARFLENGSLDTTFNSTGYKVIDFSGNYDVANAVVCYDDFIVAVGYARMSGSDEVAIYACQADGSAPGIPLFGVNATTGKGTFRPGNTAGACHEACDCVLYQNGEQTNLFITGKTLQDGKIHLFLRGCREEGSLVWQYISDRTNQDSGESISLDGQKKLVVAGTDSQPSGDWQFAVIRWKQDGSDFPLDTFFGTNGWAVASIEGKMVSESVAIQADNKIIVVGHQATTPEKVVLARYIGYEGNITIKIGVLPLQGIQSEYPIRLTFGQKQTKVKVEVQWNDESGDVLLRLKRQWPAPTRIEAEEYPSSRAGAINVTYLDVDGELYLAVKHQPAYQGNPGSKKPTRDITVTISKYDTMPTNMRLEIWLGDPGGITGGLPFYHELILPQSPTEFISEYPNGAVTSEKILTSPWTWHMEDSTPSIISNYPATLDVSFIAK